MKLKPLLKELFGVEDDLFKFLIGSRRAWKTNNYVPISIPIVKKLVGNIKTIKAAHSTDIRSLPKLLSLQGKKKGISTFTALDEKSKIMSGDGVATDGGVIVILSGDLLYQDKLDVMSVLDKSGRRWINVREIFGEKMFYISDHLSPTSKDIVKKVQNQDFIAITNKEKQYFIKDYIDTGTKLMMQNKDVFIDKYFKNNQYSPKKADWYLEWNEVIVTKINIEAIAFIKDSPDFRLFDSAEMEFLQKKYKKSEVITTKEIKNFFKKHGIKLYSL